MFVASRCLTMFGMIMITLFALVFSTTAKNDDERVLLPVSVGDFICVNGYVMDYFCILRGTLFDNPSVQTLGSGGPTLHSIHCLIDVPQCVNSPFEILYDVSDGKGEKYGRAWRVANNDLLISHARNVGDCNDQCTGDQVKGLQATVIGKVLDVGNSTTPALIKVEQVGKGTIGCGNLTYEVPNMVLDAGNN
jgi:hypothetical protein